MPLTENEWFTEAFEERTAFSARITKKLYEELSDFQRIEIFQTEAIGRVLVLDGCFMVTEKDAFIYHEMLVHPAMSTLPDPRNVLVIGGGDGGAVTEIVKYSNVESVTLCEIDPLVVSSCRKYFPAVSSGLADPRVKVICEDGAAFVRRRPGEFDLVLVDSTDPVGPGVALFQRSFYEAVRDSLTEGGAAVFQTESPLFMERVFSMAFQDLGAVFGPACVRAYLATIPSYPGALWSFTFCSERHNPVAAAPALPSEVSTKLEYFSPDVHGAAFVLPPFVRRLTQQSQ